MQTSGRSPQSEGRQSTSPYANGYSLQTPYGAGSGQLSSSSALQSSQAATNTEMQQRAYLQQLLMSGNPPGWLLNAMKAAQDPVAFMQAFTQTPAPPAPSAPPPAFGINPALLSAPSPRRVAPTAAAPPAAFGIDPALLSAPSPRRVAPTAAAPPAAFGIDPALLSAPPPRVATTAAAPPAAFGIDPALLSAPPPQVTPTPPAAPPAAAVVGGLPSSHPIPQTLPTPPVTANNNAATSSAAAIELDPYDLLTEAEETPEDFDEAADGSFVPRTDIKGRHVSALNAKYGVVKGVGRGKRKWVVARTIKPGPVFAHQRDATRAHNAMLRALLSKAEYLSDRTRSWLYIAAQHPGSNLPFIHFASSKLRQRPVPLAKLHKAAKNVMGALSDESRQTVTTLSLQVREQEGLIKGLEGEIKGYQDLLADKEVSLNDLRRAMTLVRSGDPVVLACLKAPVPGEQPADTL